MKPVFSHLKKAIKVIPGGLSVEAPTEILTVDLEQASPMKNHEQQLSLVVSKKPIDREGHGQNFYKSQLDGFMNSACCRLLIFWSVITTLSSVVSIYYAIDAQSRLTEAHDSNVRLRSRNYQRGFDNSMIEKMKDQIMGQENFAMREINNFFREGDEPEMSRDDSANSVVVVKIDGSGFAPEQIINSQMLSGIEALLDTPQIIKEFHSMLHPLTEMIHEHESRGQLPKLSKNEKAKKLLRNAPSYVQKWQEVLGSFQDGEKPSMEIDLDFYDDELVETIDDDIKVQLHAQYKDMQDLKDMEKDLAKMYEEQDDYFGTKDHQNTIEFFNEMNDQDDNIEISIDDNGSMEIYLENDNNEEKQQVSSEEQNSVEIIVDNGKNEIFETIKESQEETIRLEAKDIAELKSKEQALIEKLEADEDYDSNEAKIEALENLDHERISMDLKNFDETVEDGYSKTGIEASSLDELEEREQEFVNDLRKEDEFFHTENNEVEIQLLDHLDQNMELLENFHIELGKDGDEIYETFDNGITKTKLRASDLKELKQKEIDFLEFVQSRKSKVSAKEEPLFSKSLEKVTTIDDDFKDPRLDESEEQNDDQSNLETDSSEEKETIIEKGDTDFKKIETEPKSKAFSASEEVKYDSDFLIEGDLEEMMPNSDDYYDDYTAYTTPETTSFEEDVNSKEDSFKETEEAIPIDAIGQVKPIQLSELEDELNAWLNARFGRRQAQI